MNLIDVSKEFEKETACLAYLEKMRWPDGVRCVECNSNKISRITRHKQGKNKRQNLFQCLSCAAQFSATAGTIFQDSHLPLSKWFLAVALVLNAKKGLSAKQLQRDLGIGSYRTAWYLAHRIRKAMEEGDLPKFTGIVEADETYVGGKSRNMHADVRRRRITGTGGMDKAPVFGLMQRGGRVETYSVPNTRKSVLVGKIRDRVSTDAEMVVTDEYKSYRGLGETHRHSIINHIREWARGQIHTNTIENFWSLFKRGLMGSFHKVRVKHLPRYLAEFTYRFNGREFPDLFDLTLGRLVNREGMTYRNVVASE